MVASEARCEAEAKQDGYWAFHTNIRQSFEVVALDYEGTQERSSEVEIQVMTQLAEVISELTHTYYEARRVNPPSETPVFWDEDSPEADAIGLSYQSREVDRRLLQLRRKVRRLNDG